MEYCTLGHILSLWETLSVEIARTLTLSKEVITVIFSCFILIVWNISLPILIEK